MIGKSDTCTREELAAFKVRIRAQLTEHQICVYNFPGAEEGAEEANMVPFAVVGSNTVLKDDHGKKNAQKGINSLNVKQSNLRKESERKALPLGHSEH